MPVSVVEMLYIKKAQQATKLQASPDIYVCVKSGCKGPDGLQTRFRLATEGSGHVALTKHKVLHIWNLKSV